MATQIVTTDDSDDGDPPFGFGQDIDIVEYSRLMRRIGIDGDETVARVSGFNSSI